MSLLEHPDAQALLADAVRLGYLMGIAVTVIVAQFPSFVFPGTCSAWNAGTADRAAI